MPSEQRKRNMSLLSNRLPCWATNRLGRKALAVLFGQSVERLTDPLQHARLLRRELNPGVVLRCSPCCLVILEHVAGQTTWAVQPPLLGGRKRKQNKSISQQSGLEARGHRGGQWQLDLMADEWQPSGQSWIEGSGVVAVSGGCRTGCQGGQRRKDALTRSEEGVLIHPMNTNQPPHHALK